MELLAYFAQYKWLESYKKGRNYSLIELLEVTQHVFIRKGGKYIWNWLGVFFELKPIRI